MPPVAYATHPEGHLSPTPPVTYAIDPERRRSPTPPVAYAIDPQRHLSPTPSTPIGDVDGTVDRFTVLSLA
jgi:hypothetical protein